MMAQSVQRKQMRWYYDSIIDWMIANPGKPLSECAKHVHKTQVTLSIIINSDIFKAALAQRKARFQEAHDISIIEKTTRVAHASLDIMLQRMEKKGDTVPLQLANDISRTALQRLGYGVQPSGPSVQVTVDNSRNATVNVPVSASDLAEARMALRAAERQRAALGVSDNPPQIEGEIIEPRSDTQKLLEEFDEVKESEPVAPQRPVSATEDGKGE